MTSRNQAISDAPSESDPLPPAAEGPRKEHPALLPVKGQVIERTAFVERVCDVKSITTPSRKPPWKWKWKWCLFTKHQRSSEDDERTSGPSAQVNYQVSPEEHEFFKGFRYAKKGKRDFEGRPVEEESEELREALRKSLAKDYTCLNLCCCCLVEKIVERRVEDKIDKKDDKFGLGSERRSRQSKMLADSSDTTILTDAGRGKMETTTSPSTDGEGEGAGNKRVENMSSPRSSGINIPSRIESGSFSSALDKVYREAAQSPTSSEKEGAARRALLTENSKVTVGPGSGSGPQQPVSPAAGSPVSGGAAGSPTGMPMASNPPAGSTSTDESLLLRPGLERGWGSARWRRGRKRRQDRQYMEGADLVTETGEDDTTEGTATEERKKGGKGKRHPKAEDDNHHVERLSDDSALFKLKHLTYNDDVDLRGLRSSGPLDHHRQSSVTGALLTQKEVSELFVQLADSANSALVIMEDFGGSFVKKIYKSTVAKMRERTVRFYYPWFVTRAEVRLAHKFLAQFGTFKLSLSFSRFQSN